MRGGLFVVLSRAVRPACLVTAALAVLFIPGVPPGQQPGSPAPSRGIAVLASSIGSDYRVEALLQVIDAGRFSPVVIDWAWITAHWDRTDFAQVNRLVDELRKRGVETAAMYRPRFLEQPTVPTQVKTDGSPVQEHGHEICFSSPEARAWGAAWGERILQECPGFGEIIIYNPRNACECPACTQAKAADPYAAYASAWTFLREARARWRTRSPQVKLGVVFGGDLEFWKRGVDICDVAHPYLYVLENADMARDADAARAVGDLFGSRMGACLAKMTWGEADKVTPQRLAEFDRTAQDRDLSYFLWTFDTPLRSDLYDPAAVAQALGLDYARLGPALEALSASQPAGREYTADEVRAASVDALFARLGTAEPGRAPAAALRALVRKAAGDAQMRETILQRAVRTVPDARLPLTDRYLSGYVLSGIGDPRGVPVLADVLLHDPNVTMRGCAACALGEFDVPEATAALEQAAEQERSPEVLEWIRKALNRRDAAGTQGAHLNEALAGNYVSFVLVKDFMLIANSGDAVREVEFERYAPAVDGEQVTIARWLTARSDAGEALPIAIARVTPDEAGNLIHTLALGRVPARDRVLVTLTSLVARRERPQPQGAFPIASPDEYPPDARPFLQATPMVAADHAEVRAQAEALLAESRDAYVLAGKLAALMAGKTYLPVKDYDPTLPAAASVLRYGGSCCVSAVGAAAVLRACGVPAQVTYCPAGYIHGIVQFYLNGYGWVRMDATCGTGKLPLVQRGEDLGLVRLFDTPISMESQPAAYAWPYYHNDATGTYTFRARGVPCSTLRFAERETDLPGAPPGSVSRPFGHLESGSWNRVLGGEPLDGPWLEWDALRAASRAAVVGGSLGEFREVTARLPGAAAYIASGPEVSEGG